MVTLVQTPTVDALHEQKAGLMLAQLNSAHKSYTCVNVLNVGKDNKNSVNKNLNGIAALEREDSLLFSLPTCSNLIHEIKVNQ